MDNIILKDIRDEINRHLLEIYQTGPESLTIPIQYVLNGGGKRLRPILTQISAQVFGASRNSGLSAALAVEILHNFTLVHDDIMDDDHTRHGQPTVHEKWDIGTAILTGDAMLSLAMIVLQKSRKNAADLMTVFTMGLLKVCEGQALDKEFETRSNVSIEEYLKMIDLKTGHLLGLAAEMGAIAADAPESDRRTVRDFARLVGRAFQVQDDMMEIYSDTSKMGKSLHSDILLGKKTYLMIRAVEQIPNDIQKAIHAANSDFSQGLNQIRTLLDESGIRREAEVFVEETIRTANAVLKGLSSDPADLYYFSDLITKRRN